MVDIASSNKPIIKTQQILVVDDNPPTRYSTSRILQVAGYQVREAGTGGEALQLADEDIDAVVLDVHLPDINGFEICRRLRERQQTTRLPIIYLSAAYVKDLDKVRGVHSGADAYMTHPVEPELLVATLQALIRARTAEEALRRSEARFRAIYAQAPNGICLIDTKGHFMQVNHAMLGFLDCEPEEVLGHSLLEFVPLKWQLSVSHALSESDESIWRGEFPLRRTGGDFIHLEWSLSTHIEPGVILGIATDLSERLELAKQREELLEREQAARVSAERMSRMKGELIAILSHELRTPLNAILGWVHVLKQPNASQHLVRGIDAIERNADVQTRLISDMIDASRLDMGKLELHLEVVDAVEVIKTAVDALQVSFEGKSLRVSVDASHEPLLIDADASRLQQIVWNLLTNSIKFSSNNGSIKVSLEKIENTLRLIVADEGQGIDEDFLPHLFERFTQSDSASNRYHGGLGLGLSIVKHLVKLHNGKVEAFSEGKGKGASFVVTLPIDINIIHKKNVSEIEVKPSPEALINSTSLKGLTILAVEDDKEAREMLAIILGDRGAKIFLANDYTSALQNLDTVTPDILVSDIGLPGLDGYALIREIRSREKESKVHLPAIALTAFTRDQDRDLALKAGFDMHCTKPFRPYDLISEILSLTERKENL